MRFVVDECCHRLIASALRDAGHDVTSVVAGRLSADPGRRVILVEAGPADTDERIHNPAPWPG